MKNIIFTLVFASALTARAGLFDFFDYTKFFEAAIAIADGMNENLEKVRLKQQQVLDIKEQWDMACDTTKTLNPSILAFNKLLSSYNVNKNFCAPITTVIKLQSDILARCNEYYSQPVPDNAEYLIGKFTISLLQSKMILTRCFPLIGQIKLPGLPGSN